MGYRIPDKPAPPEPDSRLPIFDIANNEITEWAIPCFYFTVDEPVDWHDTHLHDHRGWPTPTKPDASCQRPYWEYGYMGPCAVFDYIDMDKAIPIHLLSEYEGYNNNYNPVQIVFDGDISSIDASGFIDEDYDHIVRITFNPHLESFSGEPRDFIFNIYMNKYELGTQNIIDKKLLVRGKLLVFPG